MFAQRFSESHSDAAAVAAIHVRRVKRGVSVGLPQCSKRLDKCRSRLNLDLFRKREQSFRRFSRTRVLLEMRDSKLGHRTVFER